MANSFIGVDEPTTIDKRVDTEQLTVGANIVERERVQVAGAAAAEIARVVGADPTTTDMGLVVRDVRGSASGVPVFSDPIDRALRDMGKIDIAGFDVPLPAGTNNIGDVDIASPKEDADTGAGTREAIPVILVKKAAGAPDLGTAADPVRVDPTGTTPQPVTDGGGSLTVDGAVSLAAALPAGTNNIGDVDIASGPTGASALQVQGAGAAGGAPVGNPVLVGGTDGTNVQRVKVDAAGELQVDVVGPLPAGTNNIGDVDVLTVPHAAKVVGAAIASGQVSVGTTATQIVAANTSRIRLLIVQHGTTDVYLGGSTVSTTTGLLLAGTKGNQIVLRTTAAVYGIVGAGSQTVSFIEETA